MKETYYYELFNKKIMDSRTAYTIKCRVFGSDELQQDLFSLLLDTDGKYYAWTTDTISQSKIERRLEIEKELNNLNLKSV